MAYKVTFSRKVVTIDANQPGASELVKIIKACNDSLVKSSRKKNTVSIVLKKAKATSAKVAFSHKAKAFSLGGKRDDGTKIVARQSCAVIEK